MDEPTCPRWLYYDPAAADEAAHHQRVLGQIDAWWEAFRGSIGRLHDLFHGKAKWDLPQWMEQHLQAIDPRLMWEFGPALKGKGHRLVITPEWAKFLRPLTSTILVRAPVIAEWEFLGYRPPEDVENAQAAVEARTGGKISDVVFSAQLGKHNLIDLKLYSPRTLDADDQPAGNEAFVAVEALLGEERLEKWIGLIEVAPLPGGRKKASLLPLDRLRERTEALVQQLTEQLPAAPYCQRQGADEWALFKLEPEEAEDYPAQLDLLVGKARHQPLWLAAHAPVSFVSERFSRCGETFCYVKVDGTEGLEATKFIDKAAIEDALDAVLQPAGLGCYIGGGTGLRYSYVDLALTDVPRGIAAIKDCLRDGRITKRCWLQFFDDALAAEWIGIYDDTPPPQQ